MNSKIMMGGGAVLIIAISVGASMFFTGAFSEKPVDGEVVEKVNPYKDAQYVSLDPDFMVSFGKKARPNAMVVSVSAATSDEDAIEALHQHMPVIRNNLLMLYGSQDPKEMETMQGKEDLRQKTLENIQAVLEERYGSQGIDDVFFTKFVTQ